MVALGDLSDHHGVYVCLVSERHHVEEFKNSFRMLAKGTRGDKLVPCILHSAKPNVALASVPHAQVVADDTELSFAC